MIMHFILIIAIICVTDAINLGPVDVQTNPTQKIILLDSDVKTSLINRFNLLKTNNELVASALSDSHYQQIINQIAISSNVDGGISRSLQWQFEITGNHGNLRIIAIEAFIRYGLVTLYIDATQLSVLIPTQYDNIRHCARTGNRKYGLAGPRTNVCNDNYVARGLYPDEIQQVSDHLIKSIPKRAKIIRQ